MFSLNAPLPPAVDRLAADLAPALAGFDSVRDDRTLVLKRLGSPDAGEFHAVEKRARRALTGAPAVAARIERVAAFRNPPNGPGPVVYLAVESPGLVDLHARLCEAFDPVPDLEGPEYVPHVTLARGRGDDALGRVAGVGDHADPLDGLDGRQVGPVEWAIEDLQFYDARHGEVAGRVSLPA